MLHETFKIGGQWPFIFVKWWHLTRFAEPCTTYFSPVIIEFVLYTFVPHSQNCISWFQCKTIKLMASHGRGVVCHL